MTEQPPRVQDALHSILVGELEQAETVCTALLHTAPEDPDALHAMGALRLKQRAFAQAADYFQRAIHWLAEHIPSPQRDPLMAAWLADLGLARNALGEQHEALRYWEESVRLHPREQVKDWIATARSAKPATSLANKKSSGKRKTAKTKAANTKPAKTRAAGQPVDHLVQTAIAAYQSGNNENCLALCRTILKRNPAVTEAWHLRAAAYRKMHSLSVARQAIEQALRMAPDVAAYWNTASMIALDMHDLEQAKAACIRAVELDPRLMVVWNNLGIILRDLDQPDDAAECFRRALQLEPDSAMILLNYSGLLYRQHQYAQALELVEAGLRVDADNHELLRNKGVILAGAKRLTEAEAVYRRSLELDPKDAVSWMNLGNLLEETNRYQEALQAKQQSLSLNPHECAGWLNYGNLLVRLGREQEAHGAYTRAINEDAKNAKPYNNLANLKKNFGQTEKAAELYRTALKLDPAFTEACCGLAGLYTESGRTEEAEKLYEQALQYGPDDADVLFNLAHFRMSQDRFAEAESCLARGQRINPHSSNGWMILGGLRKKQGRLSASKDAIRRAIDLEWSRVREQGAGLLKNTARPPMKVDDAGAVLLELKQFLDDLKVPFFLAYGTLLGIYRDGDLLPFDKDMDLGIPWDIPRQWLIEQVQASAAFEINGVTVPDEATCRWNFAIRHKTRGIVVDFFFFKPHGEKLLSGFHHLPSPLLWEFSAFALAPLPYKGVPMPAPADPEVYLREIYGPEWSVPDPYFDSVVSGRNLVAGCRDISVVYAYIRLFDKIKDYNWKKAYGYCKQLAVYENDPWLHSITVWLQERMEDDTTLHASH